MRTRALVCGYCKFSTGCFKSPPATSTSPPSTSRSALASSGYFWLLACYFQISTGYFMFSTGGCEFGMLRATDPDIGDKHTLGCGHGDVGKCCPLALRGDVAAF